VTPFADELARHIEARGNEIVAYLSSAELSTASQPRFRVITAFYRELA
jgi:hypothetical protein